MYLHEERNSTPNQPREKRKLAEKKRTAQKQQGPIYIIKQKLGREGNGPKSEHCVGEKFDCYKKSDGKPVHTNIDDELQLLPKDNKLTPGLGISKEKKIITEPQPSVRRSSKLPFAKP